MRALSTLSSLTLALAMGILTSGQAYAENGDKPKPPRSCFLQIVHEGGSIPTTELNPLLGGLEILDSKYEALATSLKNVRKGDLVTIRMKDGIVPGIAVARIDRIELSGSKRPTIRVHPDLELSANSVRETYSPDDIAEITRGLRHKELVGFPMQKELTLSFKDENSKTVSVKGRIQSFEQDGTIILVKPEDRFRPVKIKPEQLLIAETLENFLPADAQQLRGLHPIHTVTFRTEDGRTHSGKFGRLVLNGEDLYIVLASNGITERSIPEVIQFKSIDTSTIRLAPHLGEPFDSLKTKAPITLARRGESVTGVFDKFLDNGKIQLTDERGKTFTHAVSAGQRIYLDGVPQVPIPSEKDRPFQKIRFSKNEPSVTVNGNKIGTEGNSKYVDHEGKAHRVTDIWKDPDGFHHVRLKDLETGKTFEVSKIELSDLKPITGPHPEYSDLEPLNKSIRAQFINAGEVRDFAPNHTSAEVPKMPIRSRIEAEQAKMRKDRATNGMPSIDVSLYQKVATQDAVRALVEKHPDNKFVWALMADGTYRMAPADVPIVALTNGENVLAVGTAFANSYTTKVIPLFGAKGDGKTQGTKVISLTFSVESDHYLGNLSARENGILTEQAKGALKIAVPYYQVIMDPTHKGLGKR